MNDENYSRRDFLKSTPAALAIAGAPAILNGQQRSDALQIGFVGVGNRGSFLLRNMLKVPGVQVIAVCDILPDRADKAAGAVSQAGGSAKTYTDFRKMLDQEKG